MITSLTCPASRTPAALGYLMMTLDCDATLSFTSKLSTATASSVCCSDWLTEGAGAAAGAVSSLLPSLLGTAVGACLHGADAAAGKMHTSDSSIASESFDCSASESDGGGSIPYIGGCRAAAACAAKDVVPVAERCRLECVARVGGDWGAAAVAVGGGWLECKLPEVASDGSWRDEPSSVRHCRVSCIAGGPTCSKGIAETVYKSQPLHGSIAELLKIARACSASARGYMHRVLQVNSLSSFPMLASCCMTGHDDSMF